MMLAQGDWLVALKDGMRRVQDDYESVRRLASLGVAMQAPAAPTVVDAEEVIKAWIAKRTKDRDPPKDQAIQNKKAKVCRLFAFLTGVNLPARLTELRVSEWLKRGNLGAVTESGIRRCRLKLVKAGGKREYDHLVDLSSLFGIAREYDFIKVNPVADITLPPKNRGKRPMISDAAAKAILLAAREAINKGDALQCAHPLSALTGAGNSEILEAMASEFYQLPDEGPFPGQWVWDMRSRRLKDSRHGEGSGHRPRIVPLHSALIAWGCTRLPHHPEGQGAL
jgi:hypothetical protein